MPQPEIYPAAKAACLSGPSLKDRLFYRDASHPWGSVWYAVDDPMAQDEPVIRPA